ncbi:MAG: hypothetical protein HYZ01_01890 [Ignavibacteriales bacterium]|nr:hypothetical protein [Ignavibacteriales bacterium]
MQKLIIALLALAGLVIWIGCEGTTDPARTGSLSLASRYSPLTTPAASLSMTGSTASVLAVDSITITRARLVIRDIKLKSSSDSLNFRVDPMVVELNLASASQNIEVKEVPFATYRRIEFDVHRTQQSEISGLPAAEQAKFADFLAGEIYSVIVEGMVYRTGQSGASYVYRSKINAKQKHDLMPELTVSEQAPEANITLLISSGGWFKNSNGALVDPTDTNSEGVIDENLKASIRVFKDNNKDGLKDNN